MTTAIDLRPRPLWDGEHPEPGDVHFAVGFGPHSALTSRLIAAGTASRTNHVAILEEVEPMRWRLVEALGHGVVEDWHQPPPLSTLMRVSDDPAIRAQVVVTAQRLQQTHLKYDWFTIARFIFIGVIGRVPFIFFPLFGAPPLARWLHPIWEAPLIVGVAMVVLYVARSSLYTFAVAVPWPDSRKRVICSEFARRVLEDTFGTDALAGLRLTPPSLTSPGDLLQELLRRSDYRFETPIRQAAVGIGANAAARRTPDTVPLSASGASGS